MDEIVFILIAFLSGSLPFSVWLGRLFLGVDIRQFGDGNPGATNVFKSGNNYVGLLTLMLDIGKAALPIGIAFHILNYRGIPAFLIGLAPLIGHMYSPFLRFRGGKALAVSLGAWIGLTVWKISMPAAMAAVLGILLFTSSAWAVMFSLLIIIISILLWIPTPLLIYTWLAQTILLVWTHRIELLQKPRLRSWLKLK